MRPTTSPPRKQRAKPNQRRQASRSRERKPSFWELVDWSRVRLQLAAGLFCVLWVMLWGRAFYVQIVLGPGLEQMATRQHTYTEMVEARRGNIYDRSGQVLARSVECRSVYANPQNIIDINATAAALAPLLKTNAASLRRMLESDRPFVWLTRKVDDATALAIREASLAGIGLAREYERVYPYKHLAGQLLGFVGLDNVGLEGLERSFNDVLAGTAQRNVVQRDGAGRSYLRADEADAQGKDLHLTLDVQIQFIAEDVISQAVQDTKAHWGGVLIADVASGDVLAWAQYPFFNPNNFRQSSPSEYRNRLAADALEPGSTLKPFLMAAALEERLVKPDDIFFCENGVWKINRTVIRDDGRAYGDLRADKILPYSSNIGISKIALKVGTPLYYDYLSRLGFGRRTGIGVGENRGIVRQPQDWSESDLISAAFGQSVSMTGIQMLQAYTTLANEGLFRPLRLVTDEEGFATSGAEQRIFSKATAASVMSMLIDVVDGDGTGSRARIPGLRVAGKTGTAQKAGHGQQGGYGDKRLATFAGIVPGHNPRYVVFVMLDEPSTTQYGGVVAAPVFQKVASRTLAFGGYLPDVVFALAEQAAPAGGRRAAPAEAGQPKAGQMPDVQGRSLRRAMEQLAEAGLVPEVRGDGLTVVRQQPLPGAAYEKNGQKLPCVIWMSEEIAGIAAHPAAVRAAEQGQ